LRLNTAAASGAVTPDVVASSTFVACFCPGFEMRYVPSFPRGRESSLRHWIPARVGMTACSKNKLPLSSSTCRSQKDTGRSCRSNAALFQLP
jgi:hypothetical protein